MFQLIGLLAVPGCRFGSWRKRTWLFFGTDSTVQRSKYLYGSLITSVVVSVSAYLPAFREGSLYACAFPDTEFGITRAGIRSDGLDGRAALQRRAVVYPDPKNHRRNAVVVSSVLCATALDERGVFGNLTQMIVVFVHFYDGTLLAYAYARTFSILLPFAIHFGWNYVQNFVFPRFGLRTASLHVGSSATGSDHFLSGILYDADGTQTTCAGFETI